MFKLRTEKIKLMFDSISKEYDFLNRILTFGTDFKNKKEIANFVKEKNPSKVLDIATGTADIPIILSEINDCEITGVDISEKMISEGRKKVKINNLLKRINLDIGNSERLKYDCNYFDVVTICFGVRNFEYLEKSLKEAHRVLKNSGSLIIYETAIPKNLIIRFLYYIFSTLYIPLMGLLFSKNPVAYFYLQMSSKVFPSGRNFLKILSKVGFNDFEIREKLFGTLSIYVAKK